MNFCGAIGNYDNRIFNSIKLHLELKNAKPITFENGIFCISDIDNALIDNDSIKWTQSGLSFDIESSKIFATLKVFKDKIFLETDELSLTEIYTYENGNCLYFSNTVDALVKNTFNKFTPNWDGWGHLITIGHLLGESTLFNQIKRMLPGQKYFFDNNQKLKSSINNCFWQSLDYDLKSSPSSIINDLKSIINVSSKGNANIGISGGWDSRLLASCYLKNNIGNLIGYTTHLDFGGIKDLVFSREVSEFLGMQQNFIFPNKNLYIEDDLERMRRLDYQTHMHTWFVPFADSISLSNKVLLDGIAGDTLIKGSKYIGNLNWDLSKNGSVICDRLISIERFKQSGLSQNIINRLVQDTREKFQHTISNIPRDRQTNLYLTILLTRTIRGLALSPLKIFKNSKVCMPLIHPKIIKTFLAIPIEERENGKLYKKLLKTVWEGLEKLPSTNDSIVPKMDKFFFKQSKRHLSQKAIIFYQTSISSCEYSIKLFPEQVRKSILNLQLPIDYICNNRQLVLTANMISTWFKEYERYLDLDSKPYWNK